MNKFMLFLINFILYVYVNYIKEDWSEYNRLGKFFIYPAWFVRSTLIWIISPILIPDYFLKTSKVYKEAKAIMDSPEYQAQLRNMFKF